MVMNKHAVGAAAVVNGGAMDSRLLWHWSAGNRVRLIMITLGFETTITWKLILIAIRNADFVYVELLCGDSGGHVRGRFPPRGHDLISSDHDLGDCNVVSPDEVGKRMFSPVSIGSSSTPWLIRPPPSRFAGGVAQTPQRCGMVCRKEHLTIVTIRTSPRDDTITKAWSCTSVAESSP
jgi:hypothetical protein